MARGRPVKSQIRQNIVEILAVLGKGYGYQINKIYRELFPECTREVIYYHLRKGAKLGEFVIAEVRQEQGDYSWGATVQKTYSSLGPNAKPAGDARVSEFLQKQEPEKDK